jgi:hypothetical protein
MTPPGLVAPGGRYPKNLRPIAERAAAKPVAPPRWKKMVGDFFPGGMDGAAINAAGITPVQPEYDRRKAIKTPAEVLTAPARLQSFGIGVGFSCGSSPDLKQTERAMAVLGQGGLGLPARGHYFNDDEKPLNIPRVRRLRAAFVDARRGDPDAAVRVADREIAAGGARHRVVVDATPGGDECGARVEPGGGPGGGKGPHRGGPPAPGGPAQRCGW